MPFESPLHEEGRERCSLNRPLLTHDSTADEDESGLAMSESGRGNEWTIGRRLRKMLAKGVGKSTEQSGGWTPIESNSHAFIPAIEGLRGIAVTLTITCHSLSGPAILRDSIGSMGVTIFFVLSGFLITAVLIRLKTKSPNMRSLLYRFYTDRFFRLTPGLLFMMGLIYIWHLMYKRQIMDQANRYTLLGIFYLSNWPELWWPGSVGPFPHLWSLACEEQFYIIWSSCFTLVLARGHRVRISILTVLIVISLAVRLYVSLYPGALRDMHYLYALTPNIYKMLLGSSLRLVPLPLWMQRSFTSYLGLLGIMTTIYLTSLPPPHYERWGPGWVFYARPTMLWADFTTSISTAMILCGVSGFSSSNVLLELPPVRFVGRVSYAWYLWQIPILFLTNNTYRGWPAFTDSAMAFIFASFSTVYVEEPINKWYRARRDRNWNHRIAVNLDEIPLSTDMHQR